MFIFLYVYVCVHTSTIYISLCMHNLDFLLCTTLGEAAQVFVGVIWAVGALPS